MAIRQSSPGLAERVESFLSRNFPQITHHGGETTVTYVDSSTGAVWIRLSGACDDCAISHLTLRAIEARLPKEIPAVTHVHATTTADDS